MSESQKYVRVYTAYDDGSYAGADVFYKTSNPVKALRKFKEDFPQNPYITINAVEFDFSTAGKAEKRAFRAAEKEGCVYEL